jgi:putative tryptophan/tyrosine transport system ATP-binding protein
MITLEDIHVTFAQGTPLETQALRGVGLNVSSGQFLTVIGSNGSGKSTALNVIAGGVRPNRGHVVIDGKDVTDRPIHSRARLVSRVFQDPKMGTCEDMTILENFAVAEGRTRPRGFRFAVDRHLRKLVGERLEMLQLGLEHRLSDKVGLLSGGQRQALSLLMATAGETRVLLLDEHTAALDPKSADQVVRLSDEAIARDRLTTLMVTHSMQQAVNLGDRLIMMHRGRILHDFRGAERHRLRVDDLLARFEDVRRGDQLDAAAAEMLRRRYV